MNYIGIILAVLEGVTRFIGWVQDRQKIDEGERIQIAKAAVEILRKSGYAKRALEEASALSDAELDQRLRDFEPGEPDRK